MELVQEVRKRTVLGKKVRALRRRGITPANIYGHGIPPLAIEADTGELERLIARAGRTRMVTLRSPDFEDERKVLVKAVQRDAITGALLHVDFYQVRLEDDRLPRVYVNSAYSRLLRDGRTSESAKEYIRKKIQAARWLIDSIEQRRNTLYKIATAIVDIQRPFFEKGLRALVPLKMQTIAQITSVHVSTVCRAIADKYMQTPVGIFPLKFFFTGGTRTTDGRVRSRKSVKALVRDVIDREDKANPLSDDEIAARLQAEGIDIARRTVTKYRKAMNIPSSRQRRAY